MEEAVSAAEDRMAKFQGILIQASFPVPSAQDGSRTEEESTW